MKLPDSVTKLFLGLYFASFFPNQSSDFNFQSSFPFNLILNLITSIQFHSISSSTSSNSIQSHPQPHQIPFNPINLEMQTQGVECCQGAMNRFDWLNCYTSKLAPSWNETGTQIVRTHGIWAGKLLCLSCGNDSTKSINERIQDKNPGVECCICLEEVPDALRFYYHTGVFDARKDHYVCLPCMDSWRQTVPHIDKCPKCRELVNCVSPPDFMQRCAACKKVCYS